jgi:hypothetical protein
MNGVAVIDGGMCTLFGRGPHGLNYLEPLPWPDDWPKTVSPGFIQENGFRIHRGGLSEWQFQCKHRANENNFALEFSLLVDEKRKEEQRVKFLKAQAIKLQEKHDKLKQEIYDMEARVVPVEYPFPPPPPSVPITIHDGEMIPQFSGCYFGWDGVMVRYVGKAVNLRKRLTPSHHALDSSLLLTWVEIPIEELYFAEAFYIGVLRPRMNKAKPVIERCL